jgi:mannose-6-phosphate isomerase-like protein (cupin superfamily)
MDEIMKVTALLVTALASLSFTSACLAHPGHAEHAKSSSKHKHATNLQATSSVKKGALAMYTGPAEAKGVSAASLASIPLGLEIAGMDKRQMRARIFTIAPGGAVPPHPHMDRPGHAYILSGEITEYRNDEEKPGIRKAGDLAVEKAGVDHAWFNHTSEPVKVLVVDVFNP